MDAHFAIGNFIRDALAGGPIAIKGDGTPLRSYLYTADLMIWLWTILLRGRAGRAYNVGSDAAISIGDLARLVSETVAGMGLGRAEVTIAGKANPGVPPARYVPSIARARSELGLEAWIELGQSVEKTARWHLAGRGG
jgi:dTDP-glucose 4,6-dehydratase